MNTISGPYNRWNWKWVNLHFQLLSKISTVFSVTLSHNIGTLKLRAIQFVFVFCSPRARFFEILNSREIQKKNMKKIFFPKYFVSTVWKRCYLHMVDTFIRIYFFPLWIIRTGHWPRWVRVFYTRYSELTVRFIAWTLCRTDVLILSIRTDWKPHLPLELSNEITFTPDHGGTPIGTFQWG